MKMYWWSGGIAPLIKANGSSIASLVNTLGYILHSLIQNGSEVHLEFCCKDIKSTLLKVKKRQLLSNQCSSKTENTKNTAPPHHHTSIWDDTKILSL
jgi:hypothetical protein